MENPETKKRIEWVGSLKAFCHLITRSESREFTVLRANEELSTLHWLLLDLQQTGNQS